MKKYIYILIALVCLSFASKAQNIKLDTLGASCKIDSITFAPNAINYTLNGTSSLNVVIVGATKSWTNAVYTRFRKPDNSTFSSRAELTAWIDKYFFVNASTSGSDSGVGAGQYTGWGAYQDTVFTDLAPYHLIDNSKVTLPNRAQLKIETQKPIDVSTFYNAIDSTITGRTGDGLNIYVEFVAVPSASTTYLQASVDIGGVVGELYNGVFTFPNGSGVPQRISFSFAGYTLDTWQANGAKVKVMTDAGCDIYGIRYVLTRTHKAR